ncbi:taste receptor type 2 member 40-like [Amia ocellicauda]|uniref:taste receptor type 2 member 40-like n=1 Tax=Amia ocellicauda TaxID=2972642 RepID=UPI003463F864
MNRSDSGLGGKYVSSALTGICAFLGCSASIVVLLCVLRTRQVELKEKRTSDANLIIGIVAISNMLLCLNTAVWVLDSGINNFCQYPGIAFMVLFNQFLTVCTSIWYNALLCLYYCLKILPAKTGCFRAIKSHLSHLVRWALLIIFFLCFGMSWNSLLKGHCRPQNLTNSTELLATYESTVKQEDLIFTVVCVLIGLVLPFTVMMASCVAILRHLRAHIRRMKSGCSEFSSSPRLDSERRVMRLMSCQVLLYSVSLILYTWMIYSGDTVSQCWFYSTMPLTLFCLTMSVNFLLLNPNLRQSATYLGRRALCQDAPNQLGEDPE